MSSKNQQLINPAGSEKIYEKMQFSQAVRVEDTLWVSGQTGFDENWKPAEGIENQTRLAFQGLEKIINAAGGTLADIVELVTYHTSMKDIKGFSKIKAQFIPEGYPAWTAVGVTELVMPGLLVEIRATAIIGSGKHKQKIGS
ncbi:MAG: RidA family protein [Proteobacteria bacterium]|nr:RidA family protein [Pseudomonadota bacterium]MBU1387245.1 RidA family protein [Pseudomonadota bacterium]MBU1544905.1 RidA family protein [Pseudomonadota bacterium]MBU2429748.1 RidA family protein [Pseudomonadota bacterium]MBU2482520.1 RidA family protein [Pseudomonadota bacterium]